LAQLRGWIKASDLDGPLEDLAELGTLSWGLRITSLIRNGLLDQGTVQTLALELMQSPHFTRTTWAREDGSLEPGPETLLDWSGYLDLQPIAMGGGGMVFKARDPRLDRWVALKFPRSDQPQRLAWMLREARAQAKVDHPNVVKVHEVGEHEGQPFIAMQLVQGGTLREACGQLRLEQKVILMKQVAEALHAAHLQGLLHQDIKPANILLEFQEDGTAWPFITDFGLVRQEAQEGLPSGYGSPPYSSPEQMAGHLDQLDRRSDVFSLGATLYFALTGLPPFDSTDPEALAGMEPIPLRSRDAQLPADLEAITEKCLRPQRSERYPSAGAVAEDLRRFLEGRPVEARNPTWTYRAHKLFHRNKPLVYLGTLAAVLLLSLGIWSFHAARRTAFRHELTLRYEREIRSVEHTLRLAHLSRRHDRREAVRVVRQAMEHIRQDMARLGPEALGPGSYALGQGHYILNEVEAAQQHLDRAWEIGFRPPACAMARAHVLIERFKRKKASISTRDPELRGRLLRELDIQFRDPAMACLQTAEPGDLASAYMEALKAYLSNDASLALRKSSDALHAQPWLYEALRLQYHIHCERASEATHSGKGDEGKACYEQAARCLDQVLDLAPSDPENWRLKSDLFVYLKGLPATSDKDCVCLLQKAIPLLETAIAMDPDHPDAYGDLAIIHTEIARYNYFVHPDQSTLPFLQKALAYGDMQRQRSGSSKAQAAYYEALACLSMEKSRLGEDAVSDMDRAIDGLRKAYVREEPDTSVLASLVNTINSRASLLNGQIEDVIHYKREALQWANELLKLQPKDPSYRICCLDLRVELFEQEAESGAQTTEKPDTLLGDLRNVLADPTCSAFVPDIHRSIGYTLLTRAWKQDPTSGGNPRVDFEEAKAHFNAAIRMTPENVDMHSALGDWAYKYGKWLYGHQEDPKAILAEGIAAETKVLRMLPSMPEIGFRLRTLELILARISREPKRIAAAEARFQKHLENYPSIRETATAWLHAFSQPA